MSLGGVLVSGGDSDDGGQTGTAGGATADVGAMLHHINCNRGRHPRKMQDMLAYLRQIIGEAQTAGGNAWRQYDVRFRKFAAVHQSIT